MQAFRQQKHAIYKTSTIRLLLDLSTLYNRQKWSNIFKALIENKCEPRILYSAKLTFNYKKYRWLFINT